MMVWGLLVPKIPEKNIYFLSSLVCLQFNLGRTEFAVFQEETVTMQASSESGVFFWDDPEVDLLSFLLSQILVSSVISEQEAVGTDQKTVCRAPDCPRNLMNLTLGSQLLLHGCWTLDSLVAF